MALSMLLIWSTPDMQGTPHNVDEVPPERKDKPTPGAEDTNPERQGPDPGPSDVPTEDEGEEGQGKGPAPESIPGDQGTVPNPKQ
jgi:hypothetical protein